jgi:hypothetical protein
LITIEHTPGAVYNQLQWVFNNAPFGGTSIDQTLQGLFRNHGTKLFIYLFTDGEPSDVSEVGEVKNLIKYRY